jgi:hypothetical protein
MKLLKRSKLRIKHHLQGKLPFISSQIGTHLLILLRNLCNGFNIIFNEMAGRIMPCSRVRVRMRMRWIGTTMIT